MPGMTTVCSFRAVGNRGATLLEVLFSTALTAITISVFFAGTLHVTRAWVETRPMVQEGVIAAENLELQLRADLQSSAASWAWDGSIQSDGAIFAERTWGTAQPLYSLADAASAFTSLAAWYGSNGKVFSVVPAPAGQVIQSCLVLGGNGKVIAAYECRLVEGTSAGQPGLWLQFSRWQQPTDPLAPSLVRTHALEAFRAGANLASPGGPIPSLQQTTSGIQFASLSAYWTGRKKAFQSEDSLLESGSLGAVSASMLQTIRPRFQAP